MTLGLISLGTTLTQSVIRQVESPQIPQWAVSSKPFKWLRAFLFENFLDIQNTFNIVSLGLLAANVVELKATSSKNFISIAAIGSIAITALGYLMDCYKKNKIASWQSNVSSDARIRWDYRKADYYFSATRIASTLMSLSNPALLLLDLGLQVYNLFRFSEIRQIRAERTMGIGGLREHSIVKIVMGYNATIFPVFHKNQCAICLEEKEGSQGYFCSNHVFDFSCLFEMIKSKIEEFPIEYFRFFQPIAGGYSELQISEDRQIRCPLGDYPSHNYFDMQVEGNYKLYPKSKLTLLGANGKPKLYDLEPKLLLCSIIQMVFSFLKTQQSFHAYLVKMHNLLDEIADTNGNLLVIREAVCYMDFISLILLYKQLYDRIKNNYKIETDTELKKALYLGSIALVFILTFVISTYFFFAMVSRSILSRRETLKDTILKIGKVAIIITHCVSAVYSPKPIQNVVAAAIHLVDFRKL